jgi:hypothetical protein
MEQRVHLAPSPLPNLVLKNLVMREHHQERQKGLLDILVPRDEQDCG